MRFGLWFAVLLFACAACSRGPEAPPDPPPADRPSPPAPGDAPVKPGPTEAKPINPATVTAWEKRGWKAGWVGSNAGGWMGFTTDPQDLVERVPGFVFDGESTPAPGDLGTLPAV